MDIENPMDWKIVLKIVENAVLMQSNQNRTRNELSQTNQRVRRKNNLKVPLKLNVLLLPPTFDWKQESFKNILPI